MLMRAFLACLFLAVASTVAANEVVRIAHFPNLTHVHGLVAHQLSHEGRGWFEQRLGPGVTVRWMVYTAGPSVAEAFFARSLDVAYLGPTPALNAYVRSRGDEVRIISGATRGGTALVVRPGLAARQPRDFAGLRVATPQLGNTQDVAARAWFAAGGLRVRISGGDLFIVPTRPPDQLTLFRTGRLDAAWTVEPWVSRLEKEAGAIVVREFPRDIATVLAARTAFAERSPARLEQIASAHRALTVWINENPEETKALIKAALLRLTRVDMPADLLDSAMRRLTLSDDLSQKEFDEPVANAVAIGFLPGTYDDLSRLLLAVPEARKP